MYSSLERSRGVLNQDAGLKPEFQGVSQQKWRFSYRDPLHLLEKVDLTYDQERCHLYVDA